MCSELYDPEFLSKLESAQDEMSRRIEKDVDAWNKGDLATVMHTFVEQGLDYTDYGMSTLRKTALGIIADRLSFAPQWKQVPCFLIWTNLLFENFLPSLPMSVEISK